MIHLHWARYLYTVPLLPHSSTELQVFTIRIHVSLSFWQIYGRDNSLRSEFFLTSFLTFTLRYLRSSRTSNYAPCVYICSFLLIAPFFLSVSIPSLFSYFIESSQARVFLSYSSQHSRYCYGFLIIIDNYSIPQWSWFRQSPCCHIQLYCSNILNASGQIKQAD